MSTVARARVPLFCMTIVFVVEVIPYQPLGITTNTIVMQNRGTLALATVDIPQGDYSAATFATQLQAALNAGAGVFSSTTWVVSTSSSTYRLLISNSDSIEFTFVVDSADFTMNEAMGLPKIRGGYPASYFESVSFSWTSPFAVRTLHVNFAYVLVDWPGINTVVTSKRITGSTVVSQTGMRP